MPHLHARADHLAERAALLQLPPQHAHLALRVVALDDLVEQDLQPLRIDGLREVVVGALLDRLDGGLDRALRRHQHDGDVRVVLGRSARSRSSPPMPRHHEIAQHDGRTVDGDLLERFLAVDRRRRR